MEADPDLEDVRRVAGGDLSAFEGIVRRWQGPLINLAYRFVRNRARAEDLAQDAFLQAFRQIKRYRGESAFSTWLFALALNVYRSAVRHRSVPVVPLDALAGLAGHPQPQLAALSENERDELVRRGVASLPPRYRDALVVFYFRDADLAEAARILEVPEGTLKARLHRGRELLRAKLGRALEPQEVPA